MAKTNIKFNNTTYQVDESTLASATAQLQSHLSTVMNGSGAAISLGGLSYNIDSAKLSNATNAFVSYLGTVAGNGYKIMVNGTEYSIDASKMSDAIAELETVLGNLHSPIPDDEFDGVILLSSDDLILKDLYELYLTAKEDK
jgi:hypothetical protein